MRILLAHNSLYYPSHGGGDKSNRLLMEALAARGHQVRVVARIGAVTVDAHEQFLRDLGERGVTPDVAGGSVRFEMNGVDVHTLTLDPHLRAYFSKAIADFDPDVIIASTDDPGHLLFDIARRAQRARVVYLVRATIAAPFGPDSSMPVRAKTAALAQADGIAGVSEYVAEYVRRYGGLDAVHVPISLMESADAPDVGRFDNPYVTMVNPCAVKGIDIFVALADRMPEVKFAAVPTWGTTAADRAALDARPNITVLRPVDKMDDLFRLTRVLLVPSVWAEARSRVVVEAMMRAVPVIASDAGGIREAKLGVPYLIPVNIVKHYRPVLDENMVPVAEAPAQNIEPWEAALRKLTLDREHWHEIASQSREAALRYARSLSVEPFESFLVERLRRPKKSAGVAEPPPQLSEDKRRLLALRLKQRSAEKARPAAVKRVASAWFPTLEPENRPALRLFCFPHAGGGTMAYRAWIGAIAGVAVCPVLLPGRETRAHEIVLGDMDELVDALGAAIRPYLDAPFAFFGHSMGAGVAFELARALRLAGDPAPRVLVASAARAPQLRRHMQQSLDPTDEELLNELRRLGGVPQQVLDNPEALRLALPAIRSDTRLYRKYLYRAGPPLDMPIFAYGGRSDPNLLPEHLEGWREQTTRSFLRREFEGGHFYTQSNAEEVAAALRSDLQAGVTGDS